MVLSKNFVSLGSLVSGAVAATRFYPETGGVQAEKYLNPLSTFFNVSASYHSNEASYWTSSYITGKNGHEYLLISHAIAPPANLYRASVIDLAKPDSFKTFTVLNGPNGTLPTTVNGTAHLEWDEFGFAAVDGTDDFRALNTWSENPSVQFNLTVEMSTPISLNTGNGAFQWAYKNATYEWAMPAGLTTGSFVFENETVAVDPLKSLTWFDRQWGGSGIEWTWFELHLDSTPGHAGTKYSIWFYPDGYGVVKGHATIRAEPGQQNLIAATFTPGNNTWTSPHTNNTYHQDWTVELSNGVTLQINTTAQDQELYDGAASFVNLEAFVEVTGTLHNGEKTGGFGLVEIQPHQSWYTGVATPSYDDQLFVGGTY